MKIQGIVPALLTAFDSSGQINEREVRRLAAHQVEHGATGFFLCGSAGEGVYMTPAERRRVVEIVASEVAGQVPLIAQVGAMSTEEAVALARDARAAGAAAVASLPPLLFKLPWEAVVEHIRAIGEASGLPTYYYHIPVLTNVSASAEELAGMAAVVPNFAGFKLTSQDLFLLWGVLEHCNGVEVLYGADQQLYQGLLSGACGGIGSTYNYQIDNVVGVYRAVHRGDHAAALEYQAKVNRVVEIVFKYGGNRAVEKAIAGLIGFPVGAARRPNLPFAAERLPELKKDLEQVGLLG